MPIKTFSASSCMFTLSKSFGSTSVHKLQSVMTMGKVRISAVAGMD